MIAAGRFIPPANASRGRIYFLRHGALRFADREKRYIGVFHGSLSIVDIRPSSYRLQALNLPAPG